MLLLTSVVAPPALTSVVAPPALTSVVAPPALVSVCLGKGDGQQMVLLSVPLASLASFR